MRPFTAAAISVALLQHRSAVYSANRFAARIRGDHAMMRIRKYQERLDCPEFQRMLKDARNERLDLIITMFIRRSARYKVAMLQTAGEL